MFPDFYHGCLLPIGFFTSFIRNTLYIPQNNGKLHSILEGSPFWFLSDSEFSESAKFVFFWRFMEEAPTLPANFLQLFQPKLDFSSRLISSGVSTIVAVSSTIWLIVCKRFCGILLVPYFPLMKGDTESLEGMSFSVQGNLLPAAFFLVSWKIRYQRASSFLSSRLFGLTVS